MVFVKPMLAIFLVEKNGPTFDLSGDEEEEGKWEKYFKIKNVIFVGFMEKL